MGNFYILHFTFEVPPVVRDGGATWDTTQWEFGVPGGLATAKVYADDSRVTYACPRNREVKDG